MSGGPNRVERMLNLLACLLDTRRPLTRDELVAQVSGYPSEPIAYRRAFERDKETLRAMGVPLVVETLPSGDQGYRVPPDEYFLPDLDLTGEETAALHVAVSAVLLGNQAGRGALMKLGGGSGESIAPIGTLPLEPALPVLFEAFRRRAPVTFEYRGESRTVEPWGLAARRGHWYFVGRDRDRDAMRTFRADRLGDDLTVGAPESFVVPDDFSPDASLDAEPWQYGEDAPVTARLLVDPGHGNEVEERADRIVEERADGSMVFEFVVVNRPAFRSFVLGLLDHAEILEPESLRADLLAWLAEFRENRVVSRPLAEHELSRILALVPWIVAHPGRPKTEVAEQFGVTVEELEADLDLVLMIGVPPYSPAEYIDVDAEGPTVTIRLADYFRRPLRLDPAEGLALLAAGRALLAVPGSDPGGPLATALEKLEAALQLPDLVVAIDAPEFLDAVRAGAEHGERLEIDYWSAGRDELTTRRIDPTTVFFALGEWYVNAWCHRAADERLFRVDRIRAVRPTGERFEADGSALVPGEVYRPRADDPRVTLLLPASAAWVAESYPAETVQETDDGRLRVKLAVSEPAWLARLLLRVGPDALVEEPAELRSAAVDAAARITERYQTRRT